MKHGMFLLLTVFFLWAVAAFFTLAVARVVDAQMGADAPANLPRGRLASPCECCPKCPCGCQP